MSKNIDTSPTLFAPEKSDSKTQLSVVLPSEERTSAATPSGAPTSITSGGGIGTPAHLAAAPTREHARVEGDKPSGAACSSPQAAARASVRTPAHMTSAPSSMLPPVSSGGGCGAGADAQLGETNSPASVSRLGNHEEPTPAADAVSHGMSEARAAQDAAPPSPALAARESGAVAAAVIAAFPSRAASEFAVMSREHDATGSSPALMAAAAATAAAPAAETAAAAAATSATSTAARSREIHSATYSAVDCPRNISISRCSPPHPPPCGGLAACAAVPPPGTSSNATVAAGSTHSARTFELLRRLDEQSDACSELVGAEAGSLFSPLKRARTSGGGNVFGGREARSLPWLQQDVGQDNGRASAAGDAEEEEWDDKDDSSAECAVCRSRCFVTT